MAIINDISEERVVNLIARADSRSKRRIITELLVEYLQRTDHGPRYRAFEGLKKSDIDVILDFLKDRHTFNQKKYDRITGKIARKYMKSTATTRYNINGITKWLTSEQNYERFSSTFFIRLKQFLFDCYPIDTCYHFIAETGRNKHGYVYIKKDTRQKAVKKHNIPIKIFLLYLAARYSDHYDAMMKGSSVTHYSEYLNILKPMIPDHLSELYEIIYLLNPKGQMKLIDLLMEADHQTTLQFILTEFIQKASGKKLFQYLTELLKQYLAQNSTDKLIFDQISALKEHKKKGVREVAIAVVG